MKTLLKVLIISLVFLGCEEKVIEPLEAAPYEVYFSEHLEPFFDQSCTACHNSAGSPAGLNLKAGDSYESIKSAGVINLESPKESSLYQYVNNGHQGITDKTVASEILRWVMDGALDN